MGDRGGWLDKLIIYVSVRAHSPLNNHKKLRPRAAICTHATECTGKTELHRWRLVWSVQSTSKGHLWHLRLLANDDAQRSFATTKAEQKNWHEREVNKHKAFNKTCFFWLNSLQRFDCFLSHTTLQKEKQREVLSHMTGCDAVIRLL